MDYIIPRIKKYSTVDELLKNNNRTYSSVLEDTYLSIDDLLDNNFTCIVGEPGIGKSRLIEEIIQKLPKNSHYCSASSFNPIELTNATDYYLIDALDEIDESLFVSKLKEIVKYQRNHPETKVIFSCRKHYISSYANYFAIIASLTYIELCRLDSKKVNEAISNHCSEVTQESIAKSPKLKELLSIPRYLIFLIEKEDKKGECRNIGDLFEYIIDESISKTIAGRNGLANILKIGNEIILIKRTLEKVALVMEIARRDSISKDELYTVLDGLKGNMAQMLLANFDLLFFENRILKYTNEKLQFNNSELQEYLAAKELCRQSNIESILYDVAAHKELRHIHPNWFDVVPHISYSPDGAKLLINVIKLIIGYESYLENESFESLLRYVDPSILSIQEKQDVFLLLLDHYLRVPSYIRWKSNIYELIKGCFTPACASELVRSYKSLTTISLQNIQTVLEAIVESNKLDEGIKNYWTEAANFLMTKVEDEYKLIALGLYEVVKANDRLNSLSLEFNKFSTEVKERYCDITSRDFVSKEIIDCWVEECFIGNPHAIQAVLNIRDLNAMAYAYRKIVNAEKLDSFFNPHGPLVVWYEWLLPEQFKLALDGGEEIKSLLLTIISGYVNHHSRSNDKRFQELIKTILLNEELGEKFVESIEHQWDIEYLLNNLDTEIIDGELIYCIDKILHKCGIKDWRIDIILQNLTYRVSEDAHKDGSITEYINRYSETFKRWEQNTEKNKPAPHTSKLIMAYQALSDQEVPIQNKYLAAELLAKNIEFLKQFNTQTFVDVVSSFLQEICWDKESIKRTSPNSFSLTGGIAKFPFLVLALYQLGHQDILIKHRVALAKTLPLACWHINDNNLIKTAYKMTIKNLSDVEKVELIDWWNSRKDDFLNISHKDILSCITDYGVDALSYKLEEYIQSYVDHPDIDNFLAAKDSLELIAKGYCNWTLERFEFLFISLKEEDDNAYYGINEIKLACNAIMIEKFQSQKAIQWRFDYLKKHLFKSVKHESGQLRPISEKEIEVTSTNPYMFRCFMGIADNPYLNEQMMDLFEFGLSLSKNWETREYSNYLLKQIYFFFISNGTIDDLQELRKMADKSLCNTIPFYISELMNRAEIQFMNQNHLPITQSIHLYTKCLEESYLPIRNNGDLRRHFEKIVNEVQREIQDVGIYSLLQPKDINEDFIQRELKNTIINVGCKMGLELRLDREVTLQDNKRTDILLWYGMCRPILIELKLLNNSEIQNIKERHEYKEKFIQYVNATRPCMSIFWVFDVHKGRSDRNKFEDLQTEYFDMANTRVVLTDCKCRYNKKRK